MVQVLLMIYSPAHCDSSLSIVSKTVIVTSPQLSEPVIFAGFGIASQETLISCGNSLVKIGSVSSMIVKVAEVVEEFPQLSVAVNVTVAEPVAPHVSETDAKLLVQVTFEQTSEATAPPLEANQAFS